MNSAHHHDSHGGRPVHEVFGGGQHDVKGLPAVPGDEPELQVAVPDHARVASPHPQLLHLTFPPTQPWLAERLCSTDNTQLLCIYRHPHSQRFSITCISALHGFQHHQTSIAGEWHSLCLQNCTLPVFEPGARPAEGVAGGGNAHATHGVNVPATEEQVVLLILLLAPTATHTQSYPASKQRPNLCKHLTS